MNSAAPPSASPTHLAAGEGVPRWARRVLLVIIALAVAARLAYILLFGHTLSLQTSGYDVYAINLMAGHGYTRFADLHPDSDLPPLYAFFLVGVYSVSGRSAINVALAQIPMDSLTLVALYAIGLRIGGRRGYLVGLLAAAFAGFYPYLLFQNLTVNDTAIFIVLLTTGIWSIYLAWERKQARWAILAGVLFGVAALTKTLIVLVLPWIGLWWWARLGLRRAIVLTLVLGISFSAPILPWMLRNIAVQRAFVFISTNDGSNLHQGNNPCVVDYLLNGWDAQWVHCLKPTPAGLTEVQEAAWHRDQALTYLRDNPGEWPRLFLVKLWTLWSPELLPRAVPPTASPRMIDDAVMIYETPVFQIARVAHLVYFTPLWALGLFGVWRAWRDKRPIMPIVAVLLAITIAYVLYHPSTRYRSPADPLLFVLSAYSLIVLFRKKP